MPGTRVGPEPEAASLPSPSPEPTAAAIAVGGERRYTCVEMKPLDPFSARLVQMVLALPDDAVLVLGGHDLEDATDAVERAPTITEHRGREARVVQGWGRSTATETSPAKVVSAIVGSRRLSAGELTAATKLSQGRAVRLVRTLRHERRILQRGDGPFARYAADAARHGTAASMRAEPLRNQFGGLPNQQPTVGSGARCDR